ncbi:uncharacterized protein, partial [Triticum aestivum]|uniref:uncharacterized protein n=1 Tax=Triticum aestivum TaxID=4565 RepID=UPI001D00357D
YLPLHGYRFISIVCLQNSHVLKTFIKISYSPPSSRYNALSIGIRARYSLVLCDFGLTAWSFSYVDHSHEYPKWKAMMKKRLMATNSKLWTVTEIGLTDLCKMAEADDIRKYTLLNLTAKDVICSCLSQNQFRNIMHLNHAKLIWDRLSEIYEGHRTRHDPWFEDFKESLKAMTFEPESSSSTSCLMAKDAKSLIEDIKNLHVKYEELESRHETLSTTHEKLSYDYLQRKQELEKLRAAHEDLQKENESLRAEQISPAQEGFEPPCLKCLERDNATSVAECSTAATIAISSTVDVVTNPSAEDTTAIADENARLKTLLETGMYKSLKGHQTLCDVLKRQILNRNPRKEGVGFERKMNADGSYWKPEQYPKTTWVAAKEPSADPSTLSGFTCANPIVIDESFDANYKLFKNQNGEVFARYIGSNCRNGPPMKKVWVPKRCLENLPVNVVMTPQVKKTNPRPQASYGPKASYRQRTHLSRTNANVLQGNLTQAYEYERVSSNRHVHKTKNYSAYPYEYYCPPARLFARAPKPKFSDAALRLIASKPPLKMWVAKKA